MGELAPLLPALLPALNWPLVLVLGAGAAVALLGCLDRRQRALDLTGSGKRIARQQSSEMWYQRHMRRRAAQRKADKGRKGRRGGRRKPLRYSDRETLEKALSHPLRIVIDCSYASVHTLQVRGRRGARGPAPPLTVPFAGAAVPGDAVGQCLGLPPPLRAAGEHVDRGDGVGRRLVA